MLLQNSISGSSHGLIKRRYEVRFQVHHRGIQYGVNMDFNMEITMKLNRARCYKAQLQILHQNHHEFLSFSTYCHDQTLPNKKPRLAKAIGK